MNNIFIDIIYNTIPIRVIFIPNIINSYLHNLFNYNIFSNTLIILIFVLYCLSQIYSKKIHIQLSHHVYLY